MCGPVAQSPRSTFRDRREAGRILATRLRAYRGRTDVIVVGLLRGGLPVAQEIAAALHAPLLPLAVRKLGVPDNDEYAMGAIAGSETYFDHHLVRRLRLTPEQIREVVERETAELRRRESTYGISPPGDEILSSTIILVDDGLATGATAHAAIALLRGHHPARIVVAVPVAAIGACRSLITTADSVVAAWTPPQFLAVGDAYDDFHQLTDTEVVEILAGRD